MLTDNAGYLDALTSELARVLPRWCDQAANSARLVSRSQTVGELRSRRVVMRGAERHEPRDFDPDEHEPSEIDMGRLPAEAATDFVGAAMNGKLRVVPAVKTVESEFTVVVDLSRSILEGFVSRERTEQGGIADAKINGLFFSAAAFFHVAARIGFQMRVLYSLDKQWRRDLGGRPEALLAKMLAGIRDVLTASRNRAEADPGNVQHFNLHTALGVPLSLQARGVIAVLSDFLDPFATYGAILGRLAGRNHVILADVALDRDRSYPVPTLKDQFRGFMEVRGGARHLEQGTQTRQHFKSAVQKWNFLAQKDHRALVTLAQRRGMRYCPMTAAVGAGKQEGFRRCYRIAAASLGQLL